MKTGRMPRPPRTMCLLRLLGQGRIEGGSSCAGIVEGFHCACGGGAGDGSCGGRTGVGTYRYRAARPKERAIAEASRAGFVRVGIKLMLKGFRQPRVWA